MVLFFKKKNFFPYAALACRPIRSRLPTKSRATRTRSATFISRAIANLWSGRSLIVPPLPDSQEISDIAGKLNLTA